MDGPAVSASVAADAALDSVVPVVEFVDAAAAGLMAVSAAHPKAIGAGGTDCRESLAPADSFGIHVTPSLAVRSCAEGVKNSWSGSDKIGNRLQLMIAERQRGPVAQLGARMNGIHEVTGSTPVWSTILTCSIPDTWVTVHSEHIGN